MLPIVIFTVTVSAGFYNYFKSNDKEVQESVDDDESTDTVEDEIFENNETSLISNAAVPSWYHNFQKIQKDRTEKTTRPKVIQNSTLAIADINPQAILSRRKSLNESSIILTDSGYSLTNHSSLNNTFCYSDLNLASTDLTDSSQLDFSFSSVNIHGREFEHAHCNAQSNAHTHERSQIYSQSQSYDDIKISFFEDSYIGNLGEQIGKEDRAVMIDQAIELSVKAREEVEAAIRLLERLKE